MNQTQDHFTRQPGGFYNSHVPELKETKEEDLESESHGKEHYPIPRGPNLQDTAKFSD